MPKLIIYEKQNQYKIQVREGDTILAALQQAGIGSIDAPCGGNGHCGKCLVHVAGALKAPGEQERSLLQAGETRRLACLAKVDGDCSVMLYEDELVAVSHGSGIDFKPDMPDMRGLGAAVDIGTTTVVLYLYDWDTRACLGTVSGRNEQYIFGADVISRIQYAADNEGGLERLTQAIRTQIRHYIHKACVNAGRHMSEVSAVTVVGNTVMEHIFAGVSPSSIGVAPFTPQELFGRAVWDVAENLGIAANIPVYLAPCVAGYVGGDITAGLLSSGAYQAKKPVLFLDIGTNGELAIGDNNGFRCCATAAGPAFEGAEISCGMSGVPGAIDHVWMEKDKLCYSTIEHRAPIGICGSGLVDVLAVLLERSVIDETGRLLSPEEVPGCFQSCLHEVNGISAFYLDENHTIAIRSDDIRKLQLAKAAVAAGIQILLSESGLSAHEIELVYLAGGFGNYMKPSSAAAIGLIPKELLPRLNVIGNSAGLGAVAMLCSETARADAVWVKRHCEYIELSNIASFHDTFIECLMFD